ncbi:MFS transporter [Clostridium chrysemydis]|uniref:MFS transporter n=1 Tax=Clostridium chrysemydis TaxID=2665504 RepID=UPI001883D4CA|nr:MFS transporter [Clostridium chrysemydis]
MNLRESVLFKNKELKNFCFYRLLFGISYSFTIPVIPLFFDNIGLDTIIIGCFMSLYGLSKALVQVPSGIITDTLGDKIVLVISTTLLALVPITYIFINNNILCGSLYIVQGAILGLAAPAVFSVLGRALDGKHIGESTGFASAVFTLGGGVGAFVGGYILSLTNNFNIVFWVSCISILITVVFIIFKIKKDTSKSKKCEKSKEPILCRLKVIKKELIEKKLLTKVILLCFVALLGDFIYGCVGSIFPFYGLEVLQATSFYTSTIISIYLFVFGIFAPIAGIVSDKIGIDRQMLISFLVMIVTLFTLGVVRGKIIFAVVITIYFLGATFLNAALQNSLLGFSKFKDIKGFVFGVVGASESIGYAIGPIISSNIYKLNKNFLFFGLLIFSIFIFFIYLKLHKKAFS